MDNVREFPLVAAFDAYGTLFDVHAVSAELEHRAPGLGTAISTTWRDKQLEYSKVRALSERYVPFSQVTREALRFACARHGFRLDAAAEDALMARYTQLDAHAHARETLLALRERGVRTAILSNGDPSMLDPAVRHAGLGDVLDAVLSVDAVRRFKTSPQTYQLVVERFACPASRVLFVSSNGWDACGAGWYGFTTVWINRTGAPAETLGIAADFEGRSLADVITFADALRAPSDAVR